MILTDANGRPFLKPVPPPKDATAEERIAYIRAMREYRERVADVANRAFVDAFRKGLR